ncbi:START domain-containing protein [Reichenbachiella sp.]|uniref:START domain-containing protein n=3 Tax=Reichenbachiella sp. TaxID=2184521 RepID=UPI003296CB66
MHHKSFLIFLIMSPLFVHHSYAQNPWEIDKNKDGIIVYTRIEEDSDFKSFKAVVKVNATTDKILKTFKNADNYSKWYGYTKTSQLIKQERDTQFNYVETIFPWPYRNRDMVYRMSISRLNQATTKISLKGIPEYIPEKTDIVRMKKAEGYILLNAQNGDSTEIVYIFHSEPGEKIPPWLANNSIAELPFKTLMGLREILEEENH